MLCPYVVGDYECDNCRYCKTKPHKRGGLENWNMLENVEVDKVSKKDYKKISSINDFIRDFDNDFLGNDENGILSDERTFEEGLDGGLMPTSESLTRDFNRMFGTNYKNILDGG